MRRQVCVLLIAVSIGYFQDSVTYADLASVPITTATGFQNEGIPQADHTSLLLTLDDQWAPSLSGTIQYDYYATGTSPSCWDAVSLTFDLSPIGWRNIESAELWFYAEQGSYARTEWHHYEILEGAFNPTHEDVPAGMNPPIPNLPGIVDFGSYGSNGLVGWLAAPIPETWITADTFDITLRLWNVRLDTVELRANVVPVPGAALLGALGLLYSGWRLRRKTA